MAPFSYAIALAGTFVMTFIIQALHADSSVANVPMLYLLLVTAAGLYLGSGPAIFASLLSFLAFDWFFVNPRHQLAVQDSSEWLALFMFLLTATVAGQLTALLQKRAYEERRRSLEIQALAESSWAVASELDANQALAKVMQQVGLLNEIEQAGIFAAGESEGERFVQYIGHDFDGAKKTFDEQAIKFVFESGKAINWEERKNWQKGSFSSKQDTCYLPLTAEELVLGVLCLLVKNDQPISASASHIVDSLTNHAAVVLQKDRFMKAKAASQALAEADRLKTALLSMISHDFRSPLTSIKANVSSLLQDDPPWDREAKQNLLQAIDQETDRLNRMVGNVLDLSRLEAGAWRPKQETCTLSELVGSALDSLSEEENQRIQVQLQPDIGEIFVDGVQIVQVLRNLLENALKYSPPDTAVKLNAFCAGGNLCLDVLDRGPGLPKGEEESIFQPFFRAPYHQETAVPGVGIGLAICQGLIQAHGGRIMAKNRPDGGTIFSVTLPTNVDKQKNLEKLKRI